jgi:hypothetical protein
MKWFRSLVAVMAVLGSIAFPYPALGAVDEWATIKQQIRDAKTPADHQALAAFYAKEAQMAHQLATRYLVMRDVLAAARATQEKSRAGEHWVFIAKKYQEKAKEYEIFAAMHTMMAEQRK